MNQKQPILKIRNLRVSFPIYGGLFQRKISEFVAVDGIDLDLFRPENTKNKDIQIYFRQKYVVLLVNQGRVRQPWVKRLCLYYIWVHRTRLLQGRLSLC